jgi:hypothetical protein
MITLNGWPTFCDCNWPHQMNDNVTSDHNKRLPLYFSLFIQSHKIEFFPGFSNKELCRLAEL